MNMKKMSNQLQAEMDFKISDFEAAIIMSMCNMAFCIKGMLTPNDSLKDLAIETALKDNFDDVMFQLTDDGKKEALVTSAISVALGMIDKAFKAHVKETEPLIDALLGKKTLDEVGKALHGGVSLEELVKELGDALGTDVKVFKL